MPSTTSLNRRSILAAAGASGLGAATLGLGRLLGGEDAQAATAASCILAPEEEEGPYYVDLERIRNDVREAKSGLRLRLRLTVVDATSCRPLPNAAVDIWHCDALGDYSGVNGASTTYLRGVQLTSSGGVVSFETIYPGWYTGRATHIHLKVHVGGTASGRTYSGGHVSHTGQLFFRDGITDAVMKRSPYARHAGRRTRNADDAVYTGQSGSRTVLALAPLTAGAPGKGYLGTLTLGVDPSATPAPVGR